MPMTFLMHAFQNFLTTGRFCLTFIALLLSACPDNSSHRDRDGDKVLNRFDLFPGIMKELIDLDGDGVGQNFGNCLQLAKTPQTDPDANGIEYRCDVVVVIDNLISPRNMVCAATSGEVRLMADSPAALGQGSLGDKLPSIAAT